MNEKSLSLKYVAGLVDGEGCIDMQVSFVSGRTYSRPRVRIALVKPCRFVLEQLQQDWGGHIYDRVHGGNQQDSSSWELIGYRLCIPFLAQTYNFMLIKKEQAKFAIWLSSKTKGKWIGNEVRKLIKAEMSALKHDPHRLSEETQKTILSLLGCDSQVVTS